MSVGAPMDAAWRRRALLLAIALAVLFLSYYLTFFDIFRIWSTSSTFNHGFLIVPIAIYLGMHRRADLAGRMPAVSRAGLVFVLCNGMLWLAGDLMAVAFFKHLAVVGMLIGTCWSLVGERVFRILLFPFLYLYFAVPEGEFLVPYLQDWTAVVLVKMLRLTDIPVFIEGRYLTIPSGNFVVAEACSGINYLLATLAVGAMFMYLNFRSWWRRLAFMLIAVAVPLIANGLRAYGIVMIAHLSDYKYALGVDHFIYGWVFFGLVIFILFAIGSRFSDETGRPYPATIAPCSHAPRWPSAGLMTLLVTACVLLPQGLLAMSGFSRAPAPAVSLPTISGWQGPLTADSNLGAKFVGADELLAGAYRDADGHVVIVEIAYFSGEGEGGELVSQANSLFDKVRWKQLSYDFRDAPADSVVDDLQEIRARATDGEEFLIWHWYDVRGLRSAERLPIKFRQAISRLLGEHDGGASVTIRTPVGFSDEGSKVLAGFSRQEELRLEYLVERATASSH